MQVHELYTETAHLGFESTLPDDGAFYDACNRALCEVSLLRPRVSVLTVEHRRTAGAGRYTLYSLPALATDFLCLLSPPVYEPLRSPLGARGIEGCENGAFVPDGQTLYVPSGAEGTYRLRYRPTPQHLAQADPTEDETVLSCDAELVSLLPLLVASYLLLEDEPELAKEYRDRYALRADALRAAPKCVSYRRNGW